MPVSICPTPGCCEPIKDHYRLCPNCGRLLNSSPVPSPARRPEVPQVAVVKPVEPKALDDPFAGVFIGSIAFFLECVLWYALYTTKDEGLLLFLYIAMMGYNLWMICAAARNTSDRLRLLDFIGMSFLMLLIITSPIVFYNAGRFIARDFQ